MSVRDDFINFALSQRGYVGLKGNDAMSPNLYNKYAQDLDAIPGFYNGKKNGYDWCCIFVDWCQYMFLGPDIFWKFIPHYQTGAGVKYAELGYKWFNRIFNIPEPGDEMFIYNSSSNVWLHTGIVTSGCENGKFTTIEGNFANSVATCRYPLSGYMGNEFVFGRPAWDEIEKYKKGTDGMNETELAKTWAVENGLIIGDGGGNYYWDSPCTREQVATILYRLTGGESNG